MPSVVQFVDAPTADAVVRFDFNADFEFAKRHTLADGFTLGTPSLEGDPDAVGAMYGYRNPSIPIEVQGTKDDAFATIAALSRELLRPTNWLRFQVDEFTSPVWLKTYRVGPQPLSFDAVYADSAREDRWRVDVPLVADAFAYGERETLASITITNNPAAAGGGVNPTCATLPTIRGDAAAPLRIEVNPSNANDLAGYRLMFSLLATESAITTPAFWNVGGTDGWTAGTDTAASSSDADYVSGNRRAVSFATSEAMATRLSGSAPAALPAGTYKVLVRVARSDTSSTFAMRLGQSVSFSYRYGDTVRMDRDVSSAVEHATWVDLGEFTYPWGHDAPAGQEGFSVAPDVSFQAQRVSGGGSLYVDGFLLIPVSTTDTLQCRTLFADFPVAGIDAEGGVGVFDGDTESVWGFNRYAVANPMVPELHGAFPEAVPGAVNTLHFLQQVNGRQQEFGTDASDLITATSALSISYHPRWLHIGDGS